jgi:hypothetical protein
MVKNSKRQKKDAGIENSQVNGTKKKSKQSQESDGTTSSEKIKVRTYARTDLIDFHKNIHCFSNMRDLIEGIFDNEKFDHEGILNSLVLFLLQVRFTSFIYI